MEVPCLAGHGVQAHQGLNLFTVDLNIGGGDLAVGRVNGRPGPDLVLDDLHPIEPFVPARDLDNGNQSILHILTAAERVLGIRKESLGAVFDLRVECTAHRAVQCLEIRQPGRPHQERITVRPRVLVIEIAVRMIQPRVRLDPLQSHLVQPSLNLADRVAGNL